MEAAYDYPVKEVAKDEARKFLRTAVLFGMTYLAMTACPLTAVCVPAVKVAVAGSLALTGEYANPVAANRARKFISCATKLAAISFVAPGLAPVAIGAVVMFGGVKGTAKFLGKAATKIRESEQLKEWWRKWRLKCKSTAGGSKLFENAKKGKLKGLLPALKEGLKAYKDRMFGFLKSRLGRGNGK